MRRQKMIRVRNHPGRLIKKPSVGVIRPMIFMVYNGKKMDDGSVLPVDIAWEVPADQYHLRMLAKGDLLLADREEKKKEPDAKPKRGRPKKDKSE